jgi:hypothetical protein
MWFVFLIAVLATYRLAKMLAEEEGPFKVFTRIREATPEQSNLRRGIECIMCVSMWVAFPIAIVVGLFGPIDPWLVPLLWPALSSVTVLIRRWEQKK